MFYVVNTEVVSPLSFSCDQKHDGYFTFENMPEEPANEAIWIDNKNV
jgi:hypothetical protein